MRWRNNDLRYRFGEKFVCFFAVGMGRWFCFSGGFNYEWCCRVISCELGLTRWELVNRPGAQRPSGRWLPSRRMRYEVTGDVF